MSNPSYFDVAMGELGQREVAGPDHNPRILQYHQHTSLKAQDDETPWCASFVNWCLEEACCEGTHSALARSFVSWGYAVPLGDIRVGDIVIFSRTKPWQGHVGFVKDWTENDVLVLGGNQSNAVSLKWYPFLRLVGIRRPK